MGSVAIIEARKAELHKIHQLACGVAKAFQDLDPADDAAVLGALDTAGDGAEAIAASVQRVYEAAPELAEVGMPAEPVGDHGGDGTGEGARAQAQEDLDGLCPEAEGCPRCGCRRMDDLAWDEDGQYVTCQACGQEYRPLKP